MSRRLPIFAPWVWAVLAAQLLLFGLFLVNWYLPMALVTAVLVVLAGLSRPLVVVAFLLSTRILSTGSMSWLRIGGLNIGLFEPMLLLAIVALAVYALNHRMPVVKPFPWLTPVLVFAFWQVLGLSWSHQVGTGLQDVVAVAVILVTTTTILIFVRTLDDFMAMSWVWILATVLMAILSIATNFNEVASVGKTWEIAAQGGRETGLGQQPNWFAMHLMFSVLLCVALAVIQKKTSKRLLLLGLALFIFYAQLRSGSRGGAYAIVIGSALMAASNPQIRKWFLRFLVVAVVLFGLGMLFGADSTNRAFNRIWMNMGMLWRSDVRFRNWAVCIEMFDNTLGRGVGPGGYAQWLESYDWKLYTSVHRYPHGILWGLMAHYGLVGLVCAVWLIKKVATMARELRDAARGTLAEPFAWAMPATMLAYGAWSMVEFSFDDKPFWEFLALYTSLYMVMVKGKELPVALVHPVEEKSDG